MSKRKRDEEIGKRSFFVELACRQAGKPSNPPAGGVGFENAATGAERKERVVRFQAGGHVTLRIKRLSLPREPFLYCVDCTAEDAAVE